MTKVLVIGDSCRDVFVYCTAQRLAPDIPVPILENKTEHTNPGMALNVKRNLSALGLLTEIITNHDWESITKTRFVHATTNHTFLRLDSPSVISPLAEEPNMTDFEAIVIADYNKGFLTERMITQICRAHPLVFLDTKKILGPWAEEAAFIKINDYEFQRSEATMTSRLREKVIRTMGGAGAEFQGEIYAVEPVDVRDSSGAGDAFMATLVAGFLRSGDLVSSIRQANTAAAAVVTKRGVTVVEP